MEPALVVDIVITMAYIAIQLPVATFTFARARKTRFVSLYWLTLSTIFTVMMGISGALNSPFQMLYNLFASLCMLPFVNALYHEASHSRWKNMITCTAIALTIISIIVKVVREVVIETEGLYTINHAFTLATTVTCHGWAMYHAYIYYRKTRSRKIDPWIQQRFMLLVLASLFIIIAAVPSFFMYFPDYMATTEAGFVMLLIIVLLYLAFSITNFFCWVMPRWFQKKLHMSHTLLESGIFDQDALAAEFGPGMHQVRPVPVPVTGKGTRVTIDRRDTIAVVEVLGKQLAKLISRNENATTGLIFLVIQEQLEKNSLKTLLFSDIARIINTDLKKRLRELGIADYENITGELLSELDRYKSIYFMATV